MSTRRPLIAGNWKMNGLKADGLALATGVAKEIGKPGALACELLICPPATLIMAVADAVRGSALAVGGQDCHTKPSGAHTGDISAAMLKDAGASYVIVGHSERRTDHGETDALVQAKAQAGHQAGLNVVVCIGETEAERDAGRTLDVLARQIAGSVPEQARAGDTVIAYEPVWAIGTGRTPTSAEIAAAHAHIRERLAARIGAQADAMRILYGGSVKASNAAEILRLDHVDGALVGGASLVAADFCAIARSCP